jgi:hypothetical protein
VEKSLRSGVLKHPLSSKQLTRTSTSVWLAFVDRACFVQRCACIWLKYCLFVALFTFGKELHNNQQDRAAWATDG